MTKLEFMLRVLIIWAHPYGSSKEALEIRKNAFLVLTYLFNFNKFLAFLLLNKSWQQAQVSVVSPSTWQAVYEGVKKNLSPMLQIMGKIAFFEYLILDFFNLFIYDSNR